jgi:hypothetical protein
MLGTAPCRAVPGETASCELADIFRQYGEAYRKTHRLTLAQRKAAWAISLRARAPPGACLEPTLRKVVFCRVLVADEIVGQVLQTEDLPLGKSLEIGEHSDGLLPVMAYPGKRVERRAVVFTANCFQRQGPTVFTSVPGLFQNLRCSAHSASQPSSGRAHDLELV